MTRTSSDFGVLKLTFDLHINVNVRHSVGDARGLGSCGATTNTTTSEVSHQTRTSSAPEIGSRPTTRRGRSGPNRRSGRIHQFVDLRTAGLPADAPRTVCPAE